MPRLLLITGPLSPFKGSESNVQHGNNPIIAMQAPMAVEDAKAAVEHASVPVSDNVRVATRTITETIPARTIESVQQVTAYIADNVPIPWLHGDQRMTN